MVAAKWLRSCQAPYSLFHTPTLRHIKSETRIFFDLMKRWYMCLHPGVLILIPGSESKSVPLGLFCPQFMHMTVLGSGRTGEGGWRLLSRLVLWFLRICGWLVTDLVLRWRSWGLVAHPTLSGHWEGLSYVCSLHTVHLTRSQSALWPGFLRSALWGAWVPRIQA